jgi:hypothetical protein
MNSSVHEFKARIGCRNEVWSSGVSRLEQLLRSDFGPWTSARGLWIVNSRLQTLDFFPSDFNLASVYIHSQ